MKRALFACLPVLVAALLFSACPAPAGPPPLALVCPVCGSVCVGAAPVAGETTLGMDPDFLSWPAGEHPLAYGAQTCPDCLYTAQAWNFANPVPEAVRLRILDGAVHLPAGAAEAAAPQAPGEPASCLRYPSWARHDMLVQTQMLFGETPLELAFESLAAAWCVRIEGLPYGDIMPGLYQTDMSWYQAPKEPAATCTGPQNTALDEIEAALGVLAALPEAPEDARGPSAALALSILRIHGENPLVQAAIPVVGPYVPVARWEPFKDALLKNIVLERRYQRRALTYIREALEDGEPFPENQKPLYIYLAGELERRLGHPAEALAAYARAEAMAAGNPALDGLAEWTARQREFVRNHTRPPGSEAK